MNSLKADWCPQHGYPLPCAKCGLGEFERGIQVGRKEVVDWIEDNTEPYEIFIDWKTQKRKWGIHPLPDKKELPNDESSWQR